MTFDDIFKDAMKSGYMPAGAARNALPQADHRAEWRMWCCWFTALMLVAVSTLVMGFLALHHGAGDRSLALTSSMVMSLALLLAVVGFAWRKAAQLADALMLETGRHAALEQEAESELQTLQFEYRDIFQSHPAPMWIFDLRSLHILAVNDAACLQYGYSRSEFLGMTIRQLRPESEHAALDNYLALPRNGLQRPGLWKHRRKNGSLLDVEIISHEMTWRGRKVRLVTATDVTQRVQAERQLQELNTHLTALVRERTHKVRRYAHKLRERKHELEIVNRDLEMFSYSASHDLRTPLFVMGIFIDMLLQDFGGQLPQRAVEHIGKVKAATRDMTALVDDLMKLAKVSKRAAQRSTVNLSELAERQFALLHEKDPVRKTIVEIAPNLLVDADPGLLVVALENLLGNAWKYSAYVPQPRIQVGVERRGDEDVFFVRDNGAGFDMEDARDLFKPFHRMHGEDKFEGTGIGLAIVQRVMALHGGRVWAEAEVDKGATFRFTLGAGALQV